MEIKGTKKVIMAAGIGVAALAIAAGLFAHMAKKRPRTRIVLIKD